MAFSLPDTRAVGIAALLMLLTGSGFPKVEAASDSPLSSITEGNSDARLSQAARQLTAKAVSLASRVHRYPYGESTYNVFYLAHPLTGYDRHQLVILLHGGNFLHGSALDASMAPLFLHFLEQGYTVASIDYRPLSVTTWPTPLYDISAGVAAVQAKLGESVRQTTLIGFSAGAVAGALLLYSDQFTPLNRIDKFIGLSGLYSRNAISEAPLEAIRNQSVGQIDIGAIVQDIGTPATRTPALLVEGQRDTFADKYPGTSDSHAERLASLLKLHHIPARTVWISQPGLDNHIGPLIALLTPRTGLDRAVRNFMDARE